MTIDRASFEAGFAAAQRDGEEAIAKLLGVHMFSTIDVTMTQRQVVEHCINALRALRPPPRAAETEQQRLAREDSDRHAAIDAAALEASLEQGRRDAEAVREATTHGGNQLRFARPAADPHSPEFYRSAQTGEQPLPQPAKDAPGERCATCGGARFVRDTREFGRLKIDTPCHDCGGTGVRR